MAKQSGLGDRLLVGGYNLSGDIGSLGNVGGGPTALDVTGIDKSGMERIGGLRDGRIEYTSWFNPSTGQAHDVLSALPTSDVHLMYLRGVGAGSPAACLVAKQIDYSGKRANDGALTFEVAAQANGYGLEWGVQLSAGIETRTTATAGTGYDLGTGTLSFGAQLHVQLLALTGTSITFGVDSSTDNAAADAYANVAGLNTGALTGPTGVRVATTTTTTAVERYVRLWWSGTFTSATFAAVIVRNTTATAF